MNYLPAIEVESGAQPSAAVIWLHGLGADGRDFEPVVPELHLPEELAVRFVFPNASAIPVTINGGMVMPAWYDILGLGSERSLNREQLLASVVEVHKLIDREIERGIDSRRIVLAGFSQGGAVNYHAALTYPRPLAGLLGLSTYFPTADSVELNDANRGLPIEIFHGTHDPMVVEATARQAESKLRDMGFSPGYRNYPMEHAVCPDEIRDIAAALRRMLDQPSG